VTPPSARPASHGDAPSNRSLQSSLRAIGQDDDDTFTANDVIKSAGESLGAVLGKFANIGQVWDMTDLKADVEEMQVAPASMRLPAARAAMVRLSLLLGKSFRS
jgi:hypothetical protein